MVVWLCTLSIGDCGRGECNISSMNWTDLFLSIRYLSFRLRDMNRSRTGRKVAIVCTDRVRLVTADVSV